LICRKPFKKTGELAMSIILFDGKGFP